MVFKGTVEGCFSPKPLVFAMVLGLNGNLLRTDRDLP